MTQTDPTKPEVGNEIRRLRESSGMTQTELARRLNETLEAKYYQTTIGRIESGERSISLPEAAIISEALNVSITQLADLSAPPSVERLCANYGARINDVTNSLASVAFNLRNAENYASTLQERIKANHNKLSVPKYMVALVEHTPDEIAAYESMLISIEKMIEHTNFFWRRWLVEINAEDDQSEDG